MGIKRFVKRSLQFLAREIADSERTVNVTAKVFVSPVTGKLSGKNVLVTGGGSGLGYAIAKKAIAEGARCLITGRNEKRLKDAARSIGENCDYIVCDMMDVDRVKALLHEANEQFGITHFDSVVCNAGISLHEGRLLDVSQEDFDRQFQTNLRGNYFLAQTYIQECMEHSREHGDLLFVSSERGLQPDVLPYGLTKAALNSFVKGINKEYIEAGIRANVICPGVTCSEMTGFSADSNLYAGFNNIHRAMLPEEIAEVAVWLLSDVSRCVAGEVIACDYGNYFSSIY